MLFESTNSALEHALHPEIQHYSLLMFKLNSRVCMQRGKRERMKVCAHACQARMTYIYRVRAQLF